MSVHAIRKIIGHISGAWVRVWPDGETWCGIHGRGKRKKLDALVAALEGAGYVCVFEGKPGTSGADIVTVLTSDAAITTVTNGANNTLSKGGQPPRKAVFACLHVGSPANTIPLCGNQPGTSFAVLLAPGASADRWQGLTSHSKGVQS